MDDGDIRDEESLSWLNEAQTQTSIEKKKLKLKFLTRGPFHPLTIASLDCDPMPIYGAKAGFKG